MGGKGSGNPHPGPVPYEKNPVAQNNAKEVDVKVNSMGIAMTKDLMLLPDIDFNDPDAIINRYFEYLELCDKHGLKPMVAGMAFAYGINRHVFGGIARDDKKYANWRQLSTECRAVIKKVYESLEQLWETYLVEEKGNPVKWIFLGKNHFSYKDQAERVVRTIDETPQLASPSAVASKYKAMVGRPTLELQPIEVKDVSDS